MTDSYRTGGRHHARSGDDHDGADGTRDAGNDAVRGAGDQAADAAGDQAASGAVSGAMSDEANDAASDHNTADPVSGEPHAVGSDEDRPGQPEPTEPENSEPPQPEPPKPERPRREPVRATIRGLGQLLITAGVVVLLFVVYELWITNFLGEQKQAAATAALDQLWAQDSGVVTVPGDAPVVTESGGTVVTTAPAPTLDPGERTRNYDTTEGVGFAKMYIPSFGADFSVTVVEGTDQRDLYAGPGHYDKTQYPGQAGNFALAGHRVNKGAPFDDLGLLNSCDAMVIETQGDWYVYRVLPMKDEVADWATAKHAHCDGVDVQTGQYSGVYGQEITSPTDIAQVYPVPHSNSRHVPDGAEPLITLTTCHPKFSDRQRMIIHGVLVASYPKADGFVPPELQETS